MVMVTVRFTVEHHPAPALCTLPRTEFPTLWTSQLYPHPAFYMCLMVAL